MIDDDWTGLVSLDLKIQPRAGNCGKVFLPSSFFPLIIRPVPGSTAGSPPDSLRHQPRWPCENTHANLRRAGRRWRRSASSSSFCCCCHSQRSPDDARTFRWAPKLRRRQEEAQLGGEITAWWNYVLCTKRER